jgi:enoyl-CoA hydratase/carnithine racemase
MTKETQSKRDELIKAAGNAWIDDDIRMAIKRGVERGFDAGHAIGRAEGIREAISKLNEGIDYDFPNDQVLQAYEFGNWLKKIFAKELSAIDHNSGDAKE